MPSQSDGRGCSGAFVDPKLRESQLLAGERAEPFIELFREPPLRYHVLRPSVHECYTCDDWPEGESRKEHLTRTAYVP